VSGVRWLGHGTVIVDIDDTRLVTDPVLRQRVAHLRRDSPVDASKVEGLAAALVSHVHFDHLDLPSLRRLGRTLPVVVPRGAGRLVRRSGLEHVVEVDEGDELVLGTLTVRATPAEHSARRGPLGVRAASLGYVITGSSSVYFAGDTDIFEGMCELGPLDLALLPVAGWGPTLPPGHMGPESAAESLRLLRPAIAVPVHWGTFRTPFARRPDDTPARAFALAAAETAPSVDVRILQIGGSCPLHPVRTMP
jgi:L-ascorbate metabolism protein UlaG (beta-lactamase superfamily)